MASIKRRSQRLYKDTDGNKGRARIRRKIREEKGILTSVVEKYNRMIPNTETLCMETILSGETAWPWQLPHSGMYCTLVFWQFLYILTHYPQCFKCQSVTSYDFKDSLKVDVWHKFFSCIPDSVDLRTKRKAFDIIMSLRRLQEEQKILVAEMDNHWKYLSTRADTLRELSCLFASETLKSTYL